MVGGFVDPSGVLPEDDIATLLHEFEHVAALNHPIGPLFRALALRALDLRNDCARKANAWREAQSDTPGLILACAVSDEFRKLVLVTAELFCPLFEGLALMAEFEERGFHSSPVPASWRLPVHLELAYLEVAKPGAFRASGNPEKRAEYVSEMAAYVWRQLEHARELKRSGELCDALFWPTKTTGEPAPTPYVYGYLFLRSLYQVWLEQGAVENISDFMIVARRLCYEVLPLTWLPFFTMRTSPGKARSPELPGLFIGVLTMLMSLSTSDVERLRTQPGLLSFDQQLEGLAPYDFIASANARQREDLPPEVRVEAELFSSIAFHVFDVSRESTAAFLEETMVAFHSLDVATRLCPVAHYNVMVVGLDTTEKTLVMLDPSQGRGTRDGNSMTIQGRVGTMLRFPLEEGGLADLKTVLGQDWDKLPRLDLSARPVHVSMAGPVFMVELGTFWEFWPHGIDDSLELEEIRPIRWFVHGRKLFVDPGDERSRKRVLERAVASRLEEGLRLALDTEGDEVRRILEEVGDSSFDGRDRTFAKAVLENCALNPHAHMQDICAQAYERILFSKLTLSTLKHFREYRFGEVGDHLEPDTARSLRRWLHRGLVLNADGASLTSAEASNDVARQVESIRRASQEILGVPLIAFDSSERRLHLDLTRSDA